MPGTGVPGQGPPAAAALVWLRLDNDGLRAKLAEVERERRQSEVHVSALVEENQALRKRLDHARRTADSRSRIIDDGTRPDATAGNRAQRRRAARRRS